MTHQLGWDLQALRVDEDGQRVEARATVDLVSLCARIDITRLLTGPGTRLNLLSGLRRKDAEAADGKHVGTRLDHQEDLHGNHAGDS